MSSNKKKVITIYQTFEQMDADRARHAASLDPVKELGETVDLILRAYGTNRVALKKRIRKNKITITKRE